MIIYSLLTVVGARLRIMGCGPSKAAEIDESSITIKPNPHKDTNETQLADDSLCSTSGNPVENTKSHRSELDNEECYTIAAETEALISKESNTSTYQKPVAFEVSLDDHNNGEDINEMRPFPKKLKKTASTLTREDLDDKIKAATERKDKELRKKKESRRASKIRREIMEARESHKLLDESDNLTTIDDRKISLVSNVMEVDMTFNAELDDKDIWDDHDDEET
jgi:hypothetical protein